jgi:hypothetical protein
MKMNLEGTSSVGGYWTHVAQDKVQWQTFVNKVMNEP